MELIPILLKDDCSKILVKEAVNQLKSVSCTVEVLRTQMQRLAERLPEYPVVMTMYGVEPSLGRS